MEWFSCFNRTCFFIAEDRNPFITRCCIDAILMHQRYCWGLANGCKNRTIEEHCRPFIGLQVNKQSVPSIQRSMSNFSFSKMDAGGTPVSRYSVEVTRFIAEHITFFNSSYAISPSYESYIYVQNLFSVCKAETRQARSCWNNDLVVLNNHRTRNPNQIDLSLVFPNYSPVFS